MTRYAIVREEKIVGVVNHDGESDHLYGDDVDLRGPVPADATLEQLLGQKVDGPGPLAFAMGGGLYTPPQTREEAIEWERADGDGDPEGTAKLNHPHLFEGEEDDQRVQHWPQESSEIKATGPLVKFGASMTAAELIAAAPSMRWFAFKSEAKRILGDAMPEKKPDIIEALKKSA